MRTALVALIAFMPTSPNGALGSLDYKKEERRALAIKSREASPKFGTPERQKLIDEVCCLSSTSTDIIFIFWNFFFSQSVNLMIHVLIVTNIKIPDS